MEFTIEYIFNASAQKLYNSWLNSDLHAQMTGGEANIQPIENTKFTAWDEYIEGKNIELVPYEYIKQSWRTSNFKDNQADSVLEIFLEDMASNMCKLTLKHSQLTENDWEYLEGWKAHYFEPMSVFFS